MSFRQNLGPIFGAIILAIVSLGVSGAAVPSSRENPKIPRPRQSVSRQAFVRVIFGDRRSVTAKSSGVGRAVVTVRTLRSYTHIG